MLDGYADRQDHAYRLAMTQAWHAGVLAKTSSTPPLAQLLGVEMKPQDPEELAANLGSWIAATRDIEPGAGVQ